MLIKKYLSALLLLVNLPVGIIADSGREPKNYINESLLNPIETKWEIKQERNKDVKIYNRGKGVRTAIVTLGSCHYLNKFGRWEDINTSVIRNESRSGYEFACESNTIKSFFTPGKIALETDGCSLNIIVRDMSYISKSNIKQVNSVITAALVADNNRLEQQDIYQDINAECIVVPDKIIIRTIIKKPISRNSNEYSTIRFRYSLDIAKGYLHEDNNSSYCIVDDRGVKQIAISSPMIYRGNNIESVQGLSWSIEKNNLKIELPTSYFNNKRTSNYPIFIDQVISYIEPVGNNPEVLYPSYIPSADAYINSYNPSQNYGGMNQIVVGSSSSSGEYRSVLQFNVPNLPSYAVLYNSILSCHHSWRQGTSGDNQAVTAKRITQTWTEGGVNWSINSKTIDEDEVTISVPPTNNVTCSWDITNMSYHWLFGTSSNYGLMLIGDNSDAFDPFDSREATDQNLRPKLVVTYALPDLNALEPPLEWDNCVVASNHTGSTVSDIDLQADVTTYISCAVINRSDANIINNFTNKILIDNAEVTSIPAWTIGSLDGWTCNTGHRDIPYIFSAGSHEIKLVLNVNGSADLVEEDYSNNTYVLSRTWTIQNHPPAQPEMVDPVNAQVGVARDLILKWTCTDADNDLLSYHIELSANQNFLNPIVNVPSYYPPSTTPCSYQISNVLDEGVKYYLRITPFDGSIYGNPVVLSFTSNHRPPQATVISPADGQHQVNRYCPSLQWNCVNDADGDNLTYQIDLATASDFNNSCIVESEITTDKIITVSTILDYNRAYYWRIRAFDGKEWGDYPAGNHFWSFTTADNQCRVRALLTFSNEDLDSHVPLPNASIKIYDNISSTPLNSQYLETAQDGTIDQVVTVTNGASGIYIKVLLENNTACRVKLDDYNPTYEAMTGDGEGIINNGEAQIIWCFDEGNDPYSRKQFNHSSYIFSAAVLEQNWVRTYANSWVRPRVDAFYNPLDNDNPSEFDYDRSVPVMNFTEKADIINPSNPVQYLSGYRRYCPYHEYAHAIFYVAYGNAFPTGNYVKPHRVNTVSSGAQALVEGFAEFMPCAIINDPTYLPDDAHTDWNIASNQWCYHTNPPGGDPYKVEGAVASILWAIPNSHVNNTMISKYQYLFNILKTKKPNDIIQLLNVWMNDASASEAEKIQVLSVYREYCIPTYNISGVVSTETGNFLANAVIRSENGEWMGDDRIDRYISTNNLGQYTLIGMVNGDHRMNVDDYPMYSIFPKPPLGPGLPFTVTINSANLSNIDFIATNKTSIGFENNEAPAYQYYQWQTSIEWTTIAMGRLSSTVGSVHPSGEEMYHIFGADHDPEDDYGNYSNGDDKISIKLYDTYIPIQSDDVLSFNIYVVTKPGTAGSRGRMFVDGALQDNSSLTDHSLQDQHGITIDPSNRRTPTDRWNHYVVDLSSLSGSYLKSLSLTYHDSAKANEEWVWQNNQQHDLPINEYGSFESFIDNIYIGEKINAPTNCSSQLLSSSVISLSFDDNSTNEDGFGVWLRSNDQPYYDIDPKIILPSYPGSASGIINNVDMPSYGITAGNDYYFLVRSLKDRGSSVDGNEMHQKIAAPYGPCLYQPYIVGSISNNYFVQIEFVQSGGASYTLERKIGETGQWTAIKQLESSNKADPWCATLVRCLDDDVQFNKTYYYRVKAANGLGSAYSNEQIVPMYPGGYTSSNNARHIIRCSDNKLYGFFNGVSGLYSTSSQDNGCNWQAVSQYHGLNPAVTAKKSNGTFYRVHTYQNSIYLDSLEGVDQLIYTASGDIHNPALATDQSGNLHCVWADSSILYEQRQSPNPPHWMEYQSTISVKTFYSKRTGSNWSAPIEITPSYSRSSGWSWLGWQLIPEVVMPHPAISIGMINGVQTVFVAVEQQNWQSNVPLPGETCILTTYLYTDFDNGTIIGQGSYPCLANDATSKISLCYQNNGEILLATNDNGVWSSPQNISSNSGESQMATLSYDDQHTLQLVWQDDSPDGFIQAVYNMDGLGKDNGWQNDGSSIVWCDTTFNVKSSGIIGSKDISPVQLFYKRFKTGSWSSTYRLTNSTDPSIYPSLPLTDIASQMGFLFTESNYVKYKRLPDLDPPTILLTVPHGNEIWYCGRSYSIQWNESDNRGVKYRKLYTGSVINNPQEAVSWVEQAQINGNTGTYNWRVPYSLNTGQYYIKIRAVDSVGNYSDNVTRFPLTIRNQSIRPKVDPLALAYNNANKLAVESGGNIHLTYSNYDSVFYTSSTDSGNTWSPSYYLGEGMFPCLSLSADGSPAVVWQRPWTTDGGGGIFYRININGTWQKSDTIDYTPPVSWDFVAGYSPPSMSILGDTVSLVYELGQGGGIPPYVSRSWRLWYKRYLKSDPTAPYVFNVDSVIYNTPPPWANPASATIAHDDARNDHILWDIDGSVYYRIRNADGSFGNKQKLSGDNTAKNPAIDAAAVASAVWEEGGNIFQTMGYNDKWEPAILLNQNSTKSSYPVVCGTEVLWTEDVSGDLEIYRSALDPSALDYSAPIDLSLTDQASTFVHEVKLATANKVTTYSVWTEEADGINYITFSTDTTSSQPIYAIDVGKLKPSIFTVYRDGYIDYNTVNDRENGQNEITAADKTVDYSTKELNYEFPSIDRNSHYHIRMSFYQETGKEIKIKPYANQVCLGDIKVPSGQLVTFDKDLPDACSHKQVLNVSLQKQKGQMVVCGKILIYKQAASNAKDISSVQTAEKTISRYWPYKLSQNVPNPCCGTTEIQYQLNKPGKVALRIYNTVGQVVRILVNEYQEAGPYKVNWNGSDDVGRHVASGIYIYRLSTGEFQDTKKMVMIK